MTQCRRLPRHIAMIMDGNGRWAQKRFLPRHLGHKAGVDTVRRVVQYCAEQHIEVLTLFAFSSENWQRPPQEVNGLIQLFMNTLQSEIQKLHRNNVRLRIIGDHSVFPIPLQQLIEEAQTCTMNNTGLHLVIAANYGGQWDIAHAAKKLAEQIERGQLHSSEINEQRLAAQLCLADLPPPDLFIRTGGEQRISNFLLWQLAYCELYFSDMLWPDFDQNAFHQALDAFATRQRRFGRTSEQVEEDA